MARMLDHIVVVDFEATCWESKTPTHQDNEIIEAGICRIDLETLGVLPERLDLFVRPVESQVSAFCTSLTTITQAQVDGGISFAELCSVLFEAGEHKQRAWASYGDYDRVQLERQCVRTGQKFPFGRTHVNVKALLALMARQPEVGMDQALKYFNLPLVGVHHRAGDDAMNIARILAKILAAARGGLNAPRV